ncbi:MAG TPA: endonuclease/exonuclease/phosphatase family protein [Chitinophagales bacterium]|nr:endonuclease/exonuclease/phosphatase family protein [Chitinophagales bacterium]
MHKTYFLLALWLLAFGNCKETKKISNAGSKQAGKITGIVAFYNVENLFDTENDPNVADEEFLPDSQKEWTQQRYMAKLKSLTQVLDSLGKGRFPAVVGLCEVENLQVLQDLLKQARLTDTYGIVHYNSPDQRGIDVALLYNKTLFTPTHSEPLAVHFDFEPNTKTRDILYVQGSFKTETLHFFVNHWPSRRDGQQASEPKRLAAAAVARKKIDNILTANPTAKIILMGDFNDEPHNNSLTTTLRAMPFFDPDAAAKNPDNLVNLMAPLAKNGLGSYNHQGNWNALDQFVVSNAFFTDKKGIRLTPADVRIYNPQWLLFTNNKGEQMPNKTYGGNKYYGGYSDHLPVVLYLRE